MSASAAGGRPKGQLRPASERILSKRASKTSMARWPAIQILPSYYLETSLIRRLSHSTQTARDHPRSCDEPRTIAGGRVQAPKDTGQSQAGGYRVRRFRMPYCICSRFISGIRSRGKLLRSCRLSNDGRLGAHSSPSALYRQLNWLGIQHWRSAEGGLSSTKRPPKRSLER